VKEYLGMSSVAKARLSESVRVVATGIVSFQVLFDERRGIQ
jgi:hypothetical protein